MQWKAGLSLGIAAAGILALVAVQPKKVDSLSKTVEQPAATSESRLSPRRLAVTVKVSEPQDLKVQEGSVVKKGQVIAARDREKQRLEGQRSQLTLSLQRL